MFWYILVKIWKRLFCDLKMNHKIIFVNFLEKSFQNDCINPMISFLLDIPAAFLSWKEKVLDLANSLLGPRINCPQYQAGVVEPRGAKGGPPQIFLVPMWLKRFPSSDLLQKRFSPVTVEFPKTQKVLFKISNAGAKRKQKHERTEWVTCQNLQVASGKRQNF